MQCGPSIRALGLSSLAGCLVIFACSGSSTSNENAIGASCSSASACITGLCAVSPDFPSGYCTQGCTLSDATSCPTASVCIDDASGVPADAGISAICYRTCSTSADCPSGYACLEKANHLVCRHGG